jgi:hypothetical protein
MAAWKVQDDSCSHFPSLGSIEVTYSKTLAWISSQEIPMTRYFSRKDEAIAIVYTKLSIYTVDWANK